MPTFIDLTGQEFGNLTVISKNGHKGNRIAWLCKCDCGTYATIVGISLTTGHTKSCGCFKRKALIERNMIHNNCNHPLYNVWKNMKTRCGIYPGASKQEKIHYIERNIIICKEWLEFKTFFSWAKNRWRKGLQIDRIDNKGDYKPKNCRFTTKKKNMQNTALSKRWFINGIKYNSSAEAGRSLGVAHSTIQRWCNNGKTNCYSERKYA